MWVSQLTAVLPEHLNLKLDISGMKLPVVKLQLFSIIWRLAHRHCHIILICCHHCHDSNKLIWNILR